MDELEEQKFVYASYDHFEETTKKLASIEAAIRSDTTRMNSAETAIRLLAGHIVNLQTEMLALKDMIAAMSVYVPDPDTAPTINPNDLIF